MSSGHDRFRRRTLDRITSRRPTHYEALGVSVDASAAEIRAAYLRRARELHPDVQRAATSDHLSMTDLNRAYQVLGRDATRREYDRSLSVPPVVDDEPTPTDGYEDWDDDGDRPPSPGARAMAKMLTPSGPARMPWKLMGVAALVGTVAVLVTAALADPPSEEPPDGVLRVGSCVTIEPNGDAREVACNGDGSDRVVALLLLVGDECPTAYATHRDRLGLGTVCVELGA